MFVSGKKLFDGNSCYVGSYYIIIMYKLLFLSDIAIIMYNLFPLFSLGLQGTKCLSPLESVGTT